MKPIRLIIIIYNVSKAVNEMPKTTRTPRQHKKRTVGPKKSLKKRMALADKAFKTFESELTFKTFYKLCDLIRYDDMDLQCEDTLNIVGNKIPDVELKEIIKFITTRGMHPKWGNCGFSTCAIIGAHHYGDEWSNVSNERLECLSPYFEDSFWKDLMGTTNLRSAKDLSPEEFHTVLSILLKPKEQK